MEKQIKKFSSDSNEDASLSLKEHVTVKTHKVLGFFLFHMQVLDCQGYLICCPFGLFSSFLV